MQSAPKINWTKYLIIGAVPYIITAAIFHNSDIAIGLLIVYAGTIANQLLLVRGVKLILNATGHNKTEIMIIFLIKMAILFLALSLSVHFMGNKVILPLLFYIAQIFILIFNIKKE